MQKTHEVDFDFDWGCFGSENYLKVAPLPHFPRFVGSRKDPRFFRGVRFADRPVAGTAKRLRCPRALESRSRCAPVLSSALFHVPTHASAWSSIHHCKDRRKLSAGGAPRVVTLGTRTALGLLRECPYSSKTRRACSHPHSVAGMEPRHCRGFFMCARRSWGLHLSTVVLRRITGRRLLRAVSVPESACVRGERGLIRLCVLCKAG